RALRSVLLRRPAADSPVPKLADRLLRYVVTTMPTAWRDGISERLVDIDRASAIVNAVAARPLLRCVPQRAKAVAVVALHRPAGCIDGTNDLPPGTRCVGPEPPVCRDAGHRQ